MIYNMVFRLFKKKCIVCDKEVSGGEQIVRFGEHFCSEEHAEEHRKKIAKEHSKKASRGGCCG